MNTLEIIRRAALNCGLISSFNDLEIPEDIEAAGYNLLTSSIIPMINCDRTLDQYMTAQLFTITDDLISLIPKPDTCPVFELGDSLKPQAKLLEESVFNSEILKLDSTLGTVWPTDDLGNDQSVGLWSSDWHLVYRSGISGNPTVLEDVNIPFAPMDVEAVIDEPTKESMEFVYRSEFEMCDARSKYTFEPRFDRFDLLFHDSAGDSKILVMPVPISLRKILNSNDRYCLQVIASAKFGQYLTDALAVRLATIYGLSTVDFMQNLAIISYGVLKKNAPVYMGRMDVRDKIRDTFRGRGIK